jgi:hypothetical protein
VQTVLPIGEYIQQSDIAISFIDKPSLEQTFLEACMI